MGRIRSRGKLSDIYFVEKSEPIDPELRASHARCTTAIVMRATQVRCPLSLMSSIPQT